MPRVATRGLGGIGWDDDGRRMPQPQKLFRENPNFPQCRNGDNRCCDLSSARGNVWRAEGAVAGVRGSIRGGPTELWANPPMLDARCAFFESGTTPELDCQPC